MLSLFGLFDLFGLFGQCGLFGLFGLFGLGLCRFVSIGVLICHIQIIHNEFQSAFFFGKEKKEKEKKKCPV